MKKVLKFLIIILLIIILLFGLICYYVINKLNKVNRIEIPKGKIEITSGIEDKLKKYRNIAIFGLDNGNRSDCIMIASINEETKEVKLVSVYRDTYLEIKNKGLDKVNHAYSYGGPALSISTLNTNLDLNITEFITVDFESTKDIVDTIGGIEITINNKEATRIPKLSRGGKYNLNGEQALAYGRIRKIDNDYVRTERMRTVLVAVFEKAKKMNPVELNNLADNLLPKLYTNISNSEIISLIPKITSYSIIESEGWPYETRGITLGGVWYGPPITLESNVIQLHKKLFNKDEYITTEKVKEISDKIINKTGYK